MREKRTWDERFREGFFAEAPRDGMPTERMAAYAIIFGTKARGLGLDPRKAGLLAARMLPEFARNGEPACA